ncbi:hypothetical protein [Xanthomonas sp. 3058]|uniref:hypothetical protein n=1 Tax=Xanthomonas sp. 3058 TaxID=3035314 RepID=UPI001622F35C|nr:hypothetical protein [Xanthomonas sp. 3058]MBB5863612.1 hypothetical protein [Xanthomonas sp. 3058]
MNAALAALGLAEDADARAIKRAYAARLKLTRPDDDPAGFQQLHDTYQAALAWSQQRLALLTASDGDNDTRHASRAPDTAPTCTSQEIAAPQREQEVGGADAPEVEAARPRAREPRHAPRTHAHATDWSAAPAIDLPTIDIAQVQQRVLHSARALDSESLQAWLLAQPDLWSLEHKPQIGAGLQHQLLAHGDAIGAHNYDVLAAFFDWNEALDAPDPYIVERARQQMHLRWLLQPPGHHALSEALRQRGDSAASVPQVRKLLALLRPKSREDMCLPAMLWPGRPTRVRRLLDLIGYVPDGRTPPPPLDRRSANAWYLAGERQMFNPIVAILGLARSVILGATFLLLCLLLAMIDHNPAPGMSPVLKVGLYGAAIIVGGWVAWYASTSLLRWQSRPEADPRVAHPLLQRWFIPVIGLIPAALIVTGHHDAATVIALPLLLMALLRWARREGKRRQIQWSWGWVWAAVFCLKVVLIAFGFLIAYPQAALAATAVAWGADLITQRKVRRATAG